MTIEVETLAPVAFRRDENGVVYPLEGVESIFLTGSSIEMCELGSLVESSAQGFAFGTIGKETLLKDIQFRGAISDFHPIKAKIQKADYDPLLIKYNEDDIYEDGNNFELAWLKSAAEQWEAVLKAQNEEKERQETTEALHNEAQLIPRFKRTRISKPWISQGSELEVEEERVHEESSIPALIARKPRRDFNQPLQLAATPAAELWNADTMECRPFRGSSVTMVQKQRSVGVQAVKQGKHQGIQASGMRSVKAASQYEPQDLSAEEKRQIFESQSMLSFLQAPYQRLEEVFLESEVVDVLKDDFQSNQEEHGSLTDKKEALMKEYQSFTDLTYSKSRTVSNIQWSPSTKGVFAVSYVDPDSFEARSASCGKPKEFAILEWTLKSPMTPQRILLSSCEVTTFEYNPFLPLLAAGTLNGHVLIWELESVGESSSKLHPSYASSLEASEHSAITDLKWLPGYEISKTGSLTPTEEDGCFAFLTCSMDGRLVFWDIRIEKSLKKGQSVDSASKMHLRPLFSVPLFGMESEDVSLHRLCFAASDPTQLLAGSLNGELLQADLKKAEGADHPEIMESVLAAHAGPVFALERSPFFPDVVLTVGGWSFKIWKDGIQTPLFQSPQNLHKYTSGVWSPSRPAALMVSTAAGVIEVWDLLDRTDSASLKASVCSTSVTSISFPSSKNESSTLSVDAARRVSLDGVHERSGQQLLAVGDQEGTLRLMVIPRALRRSTHHEKRQMSTILQHQLLSLESPAIPEVVTTESKETELSGESPFEKEESDYMKLETDMRERLNLEQPQ